MGEVGDCVDLGDLLKGIDKTCKADYQADAHFADHSLGSLVVARLVHRQGSRGGGTLADR